jgi:hypothetical protein
MSTPTGQGGPTAPPTPTATPAAASDALKAAGDIIKVSTGLATGALVFSVSLLPNASTYTPGIRCFLILSWFSLLVSILTGVLSQSAIPVLMEDQDYNIENKWFTWPGRAHQIAFGFAIIFLAVALTKIVYSEPSHLRVRSAAEAVAIARREIVDKFEVAKVSKIELLKDPSDRASNATWHAQLELVPKPSNDPSVSGRRYLDVFITARKGEVSTLP